MDKRRRRLMQKGETREAMLTHRMVSQASDATDELGRDALQRGHVGRDALVEEGPTIFVVGEG